MTRSWRRRIAGAAFLAVVAALAVPQLMGWRASAHAHLVASSPGAGEVVAEAPEQLVLVFSEPLEPFSKIDLVDEAGTTVIAGAGVVDAGDSYQLVVPLPALPDGVYTVQWQSLSAADGHTAAGFFSFGVGDAGTISSVGSGHPAFDLDVARTLGRWLGYLGLLAGFGMPIIAAVVLQQVARPPILRLLGGVMFLSAAATLALAVRSAAEVDAGDIGAYLLASRNGGLQLARSAVLAAGGMAGLALAGPYGRAATWTMGTAAMLGIVLLVMAGHASALPGIAAIAAQAVHVAAAAVWLTGIVVLVGVALRPGMVTRQRVPLVRCVPRFSALALVSVGLLGITGFYASWAQTGVLLDPGSAYGRVLLVKIALAGAALAIGAANFLAGERTKWRLPGIRSRVVAESGLALGVLLVTGLLSATSPTDEPRGVAIAQVPNAFGRVTPGQSLELLPGRAGVNQLTISAEGAMGSATLLLVLDRLDAGGQTRIPLRHVSGGGHDMPSVDHTAMTDADGPARFVADAVVIPAGSRWEANVVVLSGPDGNELSRQRYSFEMGEATVTSGTTASIVDFGVLVAIVLAAGGAVSIGLGAGGTKLPRCDAAASRLALGGGGAIAVVLGLVIAVGHLQAIA